MLYDAHSALFPDIAESFAVGDIVSLIIGGPDMVTISVCPHGCVEVAWADSNGDVCIDVFPAEVLIDV